MTLIQWDNSIMKRHGHSIRIKILEAYKNSFARGCIVIRVERQRENMRKQIENYMANLPDDAYGHA